MRYRSQFEIILKSSSEIPQSGGDNGNVFGITNYKYNTRNQMFAYDALNRLTSAQNIGTNCAAVVLQSKSEYWSNSYIYDAWGNLLQKTVTKCGAENLSVTADAHNWIHASGTDYQYDVAGNMTFNATPPTQTYTYDQENRLTGAAGFAYTYDGDGNRVRKSSGTTGTLYWYMTPGIVGESDLSGNLTDEYVFFDGERVARKSTNGVFYYFSDHLKTASVITDSLGNIKSESDFYPWGGELQFVNNDSNHYKFTGKERDLETGLDYFGARYYSNGLGRFITPDWAPTTPKPSAVPYADWIDPQSLNQYSYVRNLPTTKLDKDGHDPGDKFKNKTAAAADAVKYIRGRSDGYKNEYGTRIEKNGKSYSYIEPLTQGKPGGVDLQPLQKNDVGDVHTHNYGVDDAHANSIEQPDRIGTVQDKDKVQKMQDDPKATVDYQSYVGAPNGDVIQFTPNPNAPDGLGDSKTVQHNVAPDPNPPPPPPTPTPTPKKEEPK
jgi:RHS repeat-associated protein